MKDYNLSLLNFDESGICTTINNPTLIIVLCVDETIRMACT